MVEPLKRVLHVVGGVAAPVLVYSVTFALLTGFNTNGLASFGAIALCLVETLMFTISGIVLLCFKRTRFFGIGVLFSSLLPLLAVLILPKYI